MFILLPIRFPETCTLRQPTAGGCGRRCRFDGFMTHDNYPHDMDWNPLPTPDSSEDVMAAIDEAGGVSRLVIADVTTDGSWLSAPEESAASLAESR
jgi:hypothetical protein